MCFGEEDVCTVKLVSKSGRSESRRFLFARHSDKSGDARMIRSLAIGRGRGPDKLFRKYRYCLMHIRQKEGQTRIRARTRPVTVATNRGAMAKQILVADDHASVRRSMRMLITQRADLQVCGEAQDGIEAIEKAKSLSPDVVVLDIAMGGLNGLDAAEEIRARCPNTVVLTTSMYDAGPLLTRLHKLGVKGFIPKSSLGTELLPAIDAALAGDSWYPEERSWWSVAQNCFAKK
jgi:CheY-like chemotaxis protein